MKINNCKLRIVWNRILDIIFPKICLGCGREGQYICKNCAIFLSEVNMFEVGPQSRIISAWEYEGVVEKAILKIKYDSCHDIINELVKIALEKIELDLPANTYITYVPMYKKRERRRGFNQAELIANKLGEIINRPVAKLLEKIKDNRSQIGLNPSERIKNIKNVFAAVPMNEVGPRSVLLVDDVYTTGATMSECIKVLRKVGIKNVYGFTLARKLRI